MIGVIEEQVGHDDEEIFYPNVSSCMTITLYMQDGSLIGTHLTISSYADRANAALAAMETMRGGRPIKKIYMVGRTTEWTTPRSGDAFRWPTFVDTVKAAFPSYTRAVFSYNSGGISADTLVRVKNTDPANPPAHVEIKISKTGLYTFENLEYADPGDDSLITIRGGRTQAHTDEFLAANPGLVLPAIRNMRETQRISYNKSHKAKYLFTTVTKVNPDRLTVH